VTLCVRTVAQHHAGAPARRMSAQRLLALSSVSVPTQIRQKAWVRGCGRPSTGSSRLCPPKSQHSDSQCWHRPQAHGPASQSRAHAGPAL
jgi:hypothetical protein